MKTKGLNRTQLKIIAIIAMVIDHTAWGFVDFLSPLGQVMHILGRFTLPIMCFFVAEGFRHTSDRRKYVGRMVMFWLISIIPFYLFFHEEYDYRQNIIFDLLLGLLALCALESKKLAKWQRYGCVVALLATSCIIGGWVLMPTLYILVFYYSKNFKQAAKRFCLLTVLLVAFLVVAVTLNQTYHFAKYDWVWYGELYFLGFMLALPLLARYNGEKGPNIGRYFFYIFYPSHFFILWFIKMTLTTWDIYAVYYQAHVFALLMGILILILVLFARPSKGQSATVLLAASACIYIMGFVLEIRFDAIDAYHAAVLVEYFGECLLMFAYTYFTEIMCRRAFPKFVYAAEAVASGFFMWMLFTTRENNFFYRSMSVLLKEGHHRLYLDWGTGFWLWITYMILVCALNVGMTFSKMRTAGPQEKKRMICVDIAMICPWILNLVRATGITGGYEIPVFGILGAEFFVALALFRYNLLDSIELAGESALGRGEEGVIVTDDNYYTSYSNKRAAELFGEIPANHNIRQNKTLLDIFEGRKKSMEVGDKIYEFRVETLGADTNSSGYMLRTIDVTEHYQMLRELNRLASRDSLTGIYNRKYFTELTGQYLEDARDGALFMIDMDNFKSLNDHYGHQAGDKALEILGKTLLDLGEVAIPCRIGGDEFCMFYKDETDREKLSEIAERIMDTFKGSIAKSEIGGTITISVGISTTKGPAGHSFSRLYKAADQALYRAKERSKDTYEIEEAAKT